MATRRNQPRTAGKPTSTPDTAATGRSPALVERVRLDAFLLFEERQRAGVFGDPVSDWLRAEHELNGVSG